MSETRLESSKLLKLKRWNTPTIYNGWEQVTNHDISKECFNREKVTDFMPQMGPMVGYAITVVIEPSRKEHKLNNPLASHQYREYVASLPGPKIVIVQDLDKPNHVGAFWGEVNSNIHRALGCVGTITDGCIRDVDEMTAAGFKAIAGGLCIGHAWSTPVRWNCEVEVFGCEVKPGQLIHADKHGFLVVPKEDEARLLEASLYMDNNECDTIIPSAINGYGKTGEQIVTDFLEAAKDFGAATKAFSSKKGEWN